MNCHIDEDRSALVLSRILIFFGIVVGGILFHALRRWLLDGKWGGMYITGHPGTRRGK